MTFGKSTFRSLLRIMEKLDSETTKTKLGQMDDVTIPDAVLDVVCGRLGLARKDVKSVKYYPQPEIYFEDMETSQAVKNLLESQDITTYPSTSSTHDVTKDICSAAPHPTSTGAVCLPLSRVSARTSITSPPSPVLTPLGDTDTESIHDGNAINTATTTESTATSKNADTAINTVDLVSNIQLETPPTLEKVPKIATVTQQPLVKPSSTLTSKGKIPSEEVNPVGEVLKRGSWPSLCPGRRDWGACEPMRLSLPVNEVTWPPRNWKEMSPEQKREAWRAVSYIMSLGDEEPGCFPTKAPGSLMDDYMFLALPGSGPSPAPKGTAEKCLSDLRAASFRALKYTAEENPRQCADLVKNFSTGSTEGPAFRASILEKVVGAEVPVRALRKQKVAKPRGPVPQYNPTKPGFHQ